MYFDLSIFEKFTVSKLLTPQYFLLKKQNAAPILSVSRFVLPTANCLLPTFLFCSKSFHTNNADSNQEHEKDFGKWHFLLEKQDFGEFDEDNRNRSPDRKSRCRRNGLHSIWKKIDIADAKNDVTDERQQNRQPHSSRVEIVETQLFQVCEREEFQGKSPCGFKSRGDENIEPMQIELSVLRVKSERMTRSHPLT